MKTWIWAVMLCLGVLVSGERARAGWPSLEQPAPRAGGGERDIALVISIEDYASLPDIVGAEANATAWVGWFAKTRGLRPDRIAFLKNNEGTPATILGKARELATIADPTGTIWVVFIGHGAPSEDQAEGVLVGWAAQQTAIELYAQSLRQSELLEALGGGQKAPITLVVDACFNGKSREGVSIATGLQPVLLADRAKQVPTAVTVLSAGGADQFAGQLPGVARPAFSYLLLGALRGWADDSTWGNGDKVVTASEAIDFTRAALRATLKGRSQTPEVSGGNPVLARGVAEVAPDFTALASIAPTLPGGSRLGGGAGNLGKGLDLSTLDLAELRQFEALSVSMREAQQRDADPKVAPEKKAQAWEALAKLRVKGQNPYEEEALANAQSWREYARLQQRMKADWTKIREALGLSVLDLGAKSQLVDNFVASYARFENEPEYGESVGAQRALKKGNAFPFGGGPRGADEASLRGRPSPRESSSTSSSVDDGASPWSWGMIGLGSAAVVTGVVTFIVGAGLHGDLENAQADASEGVVSLTQREASSLEEDGRMWKTVGIASGLTGVVLLTTGIVLATDSGGESSEGTVKVVGGPRGAELGLGVKVGF